MDLQYYQEFQDGTKVFAALGSIQGLKVPIPCVVNTHGVYTAFYAGGTSIFRLSPMNIRQPIAIYGWDRKEYKNVLKLDDRRYPGLEDERQIKRHIIKAWGYISTECKQWLITEPALLIAECNFKALRPIKSPDEEAFSQFVDERRDLTITQRIAAEAYVNPGLSEQEEIEYNKRKDALHTDYANAPSWITRFFRQQR